MTEVWLALMDALRESFCDAMAKADADGCQCTAAKDLIGAGFRDDLAWKIATTLHPLLWNP